MVARAGALDERVRSGRMPDVRPRADEVVSDRTGRALRASRQQLPTARRCRDARASRLGSERGSIGRQRIAVGCPHHDVPGAVPAARFRAACSQHRCRGTEHGSARVAAEQRLDDVERRRDASSSRAPAAQAGRVTPEAQCSAPGLPHFSATRSKSPRLQCLDDRMSASTRSNRAMVPGCCGARGDPRAGPPRPSRPAAYGSGPPGRLPPGDAEQEQPGLRSGRGRAAARVRDGGQAGNGALGHASLGW